MATGCSSNSTGSVGASALPCPPLTDQPTRPGGESDVTRRGRRGERKQERVKRLAALLEQLRTVPLTTRRLPLTFVKGCLPLLILAVPSHYLYQRCEAVVE